MIQARTFGTLLAFGALTALPGCSYFGGGNGGSQYSQATPATRYTAPAQTRQTAEASAKPTVNKIRQPVTTAMVRKVQARLKQDGLYHGRIDGLWGPKSREAAMDFQHHNGIAPTGKIDMPMLQAMNLSSGNQQYGQATGPAAPTGNVGPNRQMPNQQFGQANTGANSGRLPPTRNFTTGGQNNGQMHASNAPYPANNGMPNATGATGATGANGSNTSSGQGGPMTNSANANK